MLRLEGKLVTHGGSACCCSCCPTSSYQIVYEGSGGPVPEVEFDVPGPPLEGCYSGSSRITAFWSLASGPAVPDLTPGVDHYYVNLSYGDSDSGGTIRHGACPEAAETYGPDDACPGSCSEGISYGELPDVFTIYVSVLTDYGEWDLSACSQETPCIWNVCYRREDSYSQASLTNFDFYPVYTSQYETYWDGNTMCCGEYLFECCDTSYITSYAYSGSGLYRYSCSYGSTGMLLLVGDTHAGDSTHPINFYYEHEDSFDAGVTPGVNCCFSGSTGTSGYSTTGVLTVYPEIENTGDDSVVNDIVVPAGPMQVYAWLSDFENGAKWEGNISQSSPTAPLVEFSGGIMWNRVGTLGSWTTGYNVDVRSDIKEFYTNGTSTTVDTSVVLCQQLAVYDLYGYSEFTNYVLSMCTGDQEVDFEILPFSNTYSDRFAYAFVYKNYEVRDTTCVHLLSRLVTPGNVMNAVAVSSAPEWYPFQTTGGPVNYDLVIILKASRGTVTRTRADVGDPWGAWSQTANSESDGEQYTRDWTGNGSGVWQGDGDLGDVIYSWTTYSDLTQTMDIYGVIGVETADLASVAPLSPQAPPP